VFTLRPPGGFMLGLHCVFTLLRPSSFNLHQLCVLTLRRSSGFRLRGLRGSRGFTLYRPHFAFGRS
jgi:hypothetical protein